MKFELELEIEVGDIICFNDEKWVVENLSVVESPEGEEKSFEAKSVGTGRLRNFTGKELIENVEYSGKFARVKNDYIEIFR